MLENVIWQVETDRVPHDLADRTIRIKMNGPYREALTWGLNTVYPHLHAIERDPVAIRDTIGGDTVLIAIVDTPFIVEFWDTDADEAIALEWTGSYWNTGDVEHLNKLFQDDDMEEYQELRVIDVALDLVKACRSIGLGHLEISDITNPINRIEIIHRDKLKANLEQGSYFCRSVDDANSRYVCDVADLPPKDELDFLQYIDVEDPNASFIYFLYDDDLPIDIVIKNILGKQDMPIKVLTSNSTDIVDIKNLVKKYIDINDDEMTNIFIVESGDEEKRYNLFFNMAAYNPSIARYLTSDI